jgi:hypothetical protein
MHRASGVSDWNRTAGPTRLTLVLSWNIVEVDRRCGRGIGFKATEIGMITGLARAAAPRRPPRGRPRVVAMRGGVSPFLRFKSATHPKSGGANSQPPRRVVARISQLLTQVSRNSPSSRVASFVRSMWPSLLSSRVRSPAALPAPLEKSYEGPEYRSLSLRRTVNIANLRFRGRGAPPASLSILLSFDHS